MGLFTDEMSFGRCDDFAQVMDDWDMAKVLRNCRISRVFSFISYNLLIDRLDLIYDDC